MTQCRVCGAMISDDMSFCVKCIIERAHAQAKKTDPEPDAGKGNPPEAAFCLACGERLGPGAEKCEACGTLRRDHARALKWNLKAAKDGDNRAQERLGDMALQGIGVERDLRKALEWYLKSADQGNNAAKAKLGAMYEQCLGVGQDFQKAIALYREAADAGDALGQARLGDMYYRGFGIEKDHEKALDYFQASASKGNAHSQAKLGDMYLLGRGVEADQHKAMEFYQASAEQGNDHSQAQLGAIYLYGVGADRDYPKALEWNQRAAGQGNQVAQANLGFMAEKGLGMDKDLQLALDLYKKSAGQGNALGQAMLGDMYLKGSGVEKDLQQACQYFRAAAEQGSDLAQLRLGAMYCAGDGIQADPRKGFELLQRSAKQGNAQAQLLVGGMYREGRGIQRDEKKAFAWIQKSARQGNMTAQYDLGYLYEHGAGVERNIQKAREWYLRAAEKGQGAAQESLGRLYKNGLGVEENIQEAKKWYAQAAGQGNEKAKAELLNIELEADPAKRFKNKLLASFQGDAKAMAEVATMYLSGTGTEKSEENALEWFKKAFEYGNLTVRDKLQQVQRSIAARSEAEKKLLEKTGPPPAPVQSAPEEKPHAARLPFSPLPLLATAGLALAIVAFIVIGKPGGQGKDELSPALKFMAPPSHRTELPVPPVLETGFEMTVEKKQEKTIRAQDEPPPPASVAADPVPVPAAPAAPALRREYRSLDEQEISRMLAARNIFEARRNPAGNYRHRYETRNVAGLVLVIDRATKLVWMKPRNPVRMNLEKTRDWIGKLNAAGYGGIDDWRLPTVEEAASLLRNVPDGEKIFLDAVFGKDIRSTWTGDRASASASWVIDFQNGVIGQEKNKGRLPVLMVSSGAGSLEREGTDGQQ